MREQRRQNVEFSYLRVQTIGAMVQQRSPAPYLFPEGSRMGRDNLVLHASAKRHRVRDFPGPLSLKSVVRGQVVWTIEGRELVVDPETFLILNAGQKYSMEIEAPRAVETCCAFFQQGFVEGVALDMSSPLEASLEAPGREAPGLKFLSRLHGDRNGRILPRLRSLAERCVNQLQPSGFEEDFLILSQELTTLHVETAAQIARVPAARRSTREELFRRLQIAREYLQGNANERLSLEDVAREACLSRYHLHRAFKATFRQTPHAYLTGLRLNRARALLREGWTVTEASLEVGFASMSAFSRLFRAHFGVSPSSQISKIGQAGG
jgi:AraC family transcriptional regulator